MSICLLSYEGAGNYSRIELTEDHGKIIYVVTVSPVIGDSLVGYPIRKAIYPENKKQEALAAFRRYINKYCQE